MDRTFVAVPDGGTNTNDLAGILSLACQNKGLDAASVMAMCKNRDGFNFDDIIALIVIAALFGNGNFGFGGNNGNRNNNSNVEREMIMSAIQRNGLDLSQMASTLNCSVGQIQAAINAVATQICAVGNQVGMTGQQTINAIQQGQTAIVQQICNCCCDLKSLIQGQTNTLQNNLFQVGRTIENGFKDMGFAYRDGNCEVKQAISDSTEKILAGQRAAELREMQRDMAAKDAKIAEQAVVINNGQQSAMFAQMLQQAVAPLAAGQQALQKEVNDIICKLPETKTIQCPNHYIPVNYDINVPLSVGRAGCGCGVYNGYYPNVGYPTAF